MTPNSPIDPRAPDAADLRILVVDDEENLRALVCDYLEGKYPQATIETAVDGFTAIAAAKRLQPQLVICDYNLPDMTGLEIVARIRSDPASSGVRVLVMTGNSEPDVLARLKTGPVDAFLTKPFPMKELVTQVVALLASRP